jgi:hypothetical protein
MRWWRLWDRGAEPTLLCRPSLVPVVKTADFRNLDHPSLIGRLHTTRLRRVFFQRQVSPGSAIIAHVAPHNSPQVRFPEHDGLDCRLQPIPQMSNAFG